MSLPCSGTCWRREKRRDRAHRPVPALSRARVSGRKRKWRAEVEQDSTVVLGEQCVTEQSSPTANIAILH